jgi:hypothetical protein
VKRLARQRELSDRAEVAGSGAVGPDSFELGVLGSRAETRSAAAGVGRHGDRSQLIGGVGCWPYRPYSNADHENFSESNDNKAIE